MSSSCTLILPIRRSAFSETEAAEFREYLTGLQGCECEVLVIDGSPQAVFEEHHRAWLDCFRHVKPDPRYGYLNGKVNGIHTGVNLASNERIIIADDDIRYTCEDVRLICELLEHSDLVRPQNYLSPLPWWAGMEAARMLINRGVLRTGDYPGTCGFRRSAFMRVGPYDGDVLFDNEEMVRHFIVMGAAVCNALDLFIHKIPPPFEKWLEQRPRQAYEDFVMKFKTVLFLSAIPAAVAAFLIYGATGALAFFLAASLISILAALRGRTRGAEDFFPFHVVLYAPLWAVERSVSVYLAVFWKLVHRGYPFGEKVLSKGTGRDWTAGGRPSANSVLLLVRERRG